MLRALAAMFIVLVAPVGCGDDSGSDPSDSGPIEGAPSCGSSEAAIAGTVDGTDVDVSAGFSGGLSQISGGSLDLSLSNGDAVHLTWANAIADGQRGSLTGGQLSIGGDDICIGSGSVIALGENGAPLTFDLVELTACGDGTARTGQLLGCAGL